MTESTTWLSIAADDLQELRQDMSSGKAMDDERVFMRLLWDLAAGIVGLAQEMHSEHREAVKIWGAQVRVAGARAGGVPESEPVTPFDVVQSVTYTG